MLEPCGTITDIRSKFFHEARGSPIRELVGHGKLLVGDALTVPSELVDAGTIAHAEEKRCPGCDLEFWVVLHSGYTIVGHADLIGNATAQDSRDAVASH